MSDKSNWFLFEIVDWCRKFPMYFSDFWKQLGWDNNTIYQQLRYFYNKENNKFSHTRKKHRPEFDYILQEIREYIDLHWLTTIQICELGCGDGRFYGYLKDNLTDIEIKYVWVDFSQSFIKQADKDYDDVNARWLAKDISDHVKSSSQEQFDFIVCIASYQHLFWYQRRPFLQLCYRALKWGWLLIMTNWAWSSWFISKHLASVMWAGLRFLLLLGTRTWGDILVPFISWWERYFRFYHIFPKRQLVRLFKLSWFVIKRVWFVSKSGELWDDFDTNANTLIIGKKDVM